MAGGKNARVMLRRMKPAEDGDGHASCFYTHARCCEQRRTSQHRRYQVMDTATDWSSTSCQVIFRAIWQHNTEQSCLITEELTRTLFDLCWEQSGCRRLEAQNKCLHTDLSLLGGSQLHSASEKLLRKNAIRCDSDSSVFLLRKGR